MLLFLTFLYIAPLTFFIILLIPFQIIKKLQTPMLDRKWINLHRELPEIILTGEKEDTKIFVKNIRRAKYNPLYEYENKVEYLNKKYNLNDLSQLWIFVSNFGYLQNHLIFSFQFGDAADNNFLTLSYEIRKTNELVFKIWKVFFRNYESFYLLSTEDDVINLRTDIRSNEKVSIFKFKTSEENLKKIFLDFAAEVNKYKQKPYFYKFINRNCLTELLKILKKNNLIDYSLLELLFVKNIFSSSQSGKIQKLTKFSELNSLRNSNHFL